MSPVAAAARRTRVLLVDDSAPARDALARILEAHCGATVAGVASDGEEALRQALRLRPDLVFLDLQMPRMDGFTFLRLLMARRPTPVVVVSAQASRADVFKALELGALDFVAKPEDGAPFDALRETLVEKCALLRALRIQNLGALEEPTPPSARAATFPDPDAVVAIAASTGGPQAVQRLLASLPADVPAAFLVAQHMPERFTTAFAERLGRTTPFSVQEAAGGEIVAAGRCLVAPGGRDLEVIRDVAGNLRACVVAPERGAPARAHPSADRLFASVARVVGARAVGVVLTGMGQDGRAGVSAIKAAGGLTLAESEDSAVVYGMPQAAVASGAVDEVLPLDAIARRLTSFRTQP